MNRPGWNPAKRNRNIGTSKQGVGNNNYLVIPCINRDKAYYERIVNPKAEFRLVNGKRVKFLIEQTRRGYIHVCAVDDIAKLLSHFPVADIDGIGLIVLRQPTVKQETLEPVWGLIRYNSSIGNYKGPAIFLNSISIERPFKWSKSLNPFWKKELDRLKTDGHVIVDNGNEYIIRYNLDAVRNTQLYRTIPHEIGHYVDFKTGNGFNNKTVRDEETFAHRYADAFRSNMIAEGHIRATV